MKYDFSDVILTEEEQQNILTACIAINLRKLSNTEVAAANNAITGFGRIDKQNVSYESLLDLDLIDDNGKPKDNKDALEKALSLTIQERLESGKFT